MASILPGYEYDIFISYRQKDNKGDHWVTEFVSALKAELESAFKEDVSIYFDSNPHDGLLETHNVKQEAGGKVEVPNFHINRVMSQQENLIRIHSIRNVEIKICTSSMLK